MNEKEIHETIKKLEKLGYGIIYPKPTTIVCDNLCFDAPKDWRELEKVIALSFARLAAEGKIDHGQN